MLSFPLRATLAALASVVAATILVAAPAAAQAPGGCDADGDGVAAGTVETVFSDGADEAAQRLAADTGVVLGEPGAAQRWRVEVCTEGDPPTRSLVGQPRAELAPEAGAWQDQALAEATAALAPDLVRPAPRTSPHVDGVQYVGLEMWLATDAEAWVWEPITTTSSSGEVSVSATATPTRVTWTFSDGVTRVCEGPGVAWSPGMSGPAPCGRHFEHTTEVLPMSVSLHLAYELSWTSSLGASGTSTLAGEAQRFELVVGEVQTYLSDGERRAPPAPAPLADAPSSRAGDDEDCTGWDAWLCAAGDGARWVGEAGGQLISGLGGAGLAAVRAVWEFVAGCGQFVGEAVGSIWDLASQVPELAADPVAFVADKLESAKSLHGAITAHPEAFAAQFLDETFDLDLLDDNSIRWAGKLGCELALAVITGGVASPRIAKLLADVDSIGDWARRRDGQGRDRDKEGDGEREGDGRGSGRGSCVTRSFGADTPIVMAGGTTKPIADVAVGNQVLATDPKTGVTQARTVTATYVMLHDGDLLDLTIDDENGGGVIQTTDNHRFWSRTDRAWKLAIELSVGEQLLQEEGGTASVVRVEQRPGSQDMWDLTVEVDHSFYVAFGRGTVLVHNQDRLEHTPATHPDEFDPVRGSKAKRHKATGEIWEPDLLHKDHYEVYKNKKDWEKGNRGRAVWSDGSVQGMLLMGELPTPDQIFGAHDEPGGLEIRLVEASDPDERFVLISGSREALRLLAAVLDALADSPHLPASTQFGPRSAGRFHLSPSSNIAVYLQCEPKVT